VDRPVRARGFAIALLLASLSVGVAHADSPREDRVLRIEHAPGGAPPSLGPADAPVQIELFFLPGATNTRLPYQLVSELWRNHPTRIRVIFRVLSRQGQLNLPSAVLEAAVQGKFFEFMTAVNTRLRGMLPSQIRELADSVGLDLERVDAALLDGRHHKAFEENERRRTRMRARQIPDVLFSGRMATRPITVLGGADLEAAYREAYERAADALDRGVPREQLAAALDEAALAQRPVTPVTLGPTDERSESDDARVEVSATGLLSPPLELRGLPMSPSSPRDDDPRDASGAPASAARPHLPIVVACNPLSILCYRQLQLANTVAAVFDGQVQVVWAPMFDPRSRDALASSRASDAALCAESLGAGWSALDILVAQTNRRRGRAIEADRVIDDLIGEADLDGPSLASCLAISAGAAISRALELRQAGMRASPTVVVGGRMYPGGVSDAATLQNLVEDELSGGWLATLGPFR
jgi:predicted DsbA family dithiol-disulfide isomerase